MAIRKFDNLWKLLKDFNFEFDKETNDDVICIICNNILINGHHGHCGCKYCLDCVTNYLDGSNKLCPGNMEDCKFELLNFDTNICIDYTINIKISKLIFKCPEKSCNYKDELRKMEDHMRVCNSRSVNCPYCNIGCKLDKVANDKLEEHLLLDNQVHVKLLMECIDMMRNEMDSLRKEIKTNDDKNQIANLQLQTEIEQQTREIAILNIDNLALKNMDKFQQDELKIVQTRERETNAKLIRLNEKFVTLSDEIYDCKIQAEQYKHQFNKSIAEISHNNTNISTNYSQINTEKKAGKLMSDIKIMYNNDKNSEFIWTIDKIFHKIEQWKTGINIKIYSDNFYSHENGYNLCLYATIGRWFRDCFDVGLCICRGEFDDILSWPFKHIVTISIINQQDNFIYCTTTIQFDGQPNNNNWNKPIKDRNNPIYSQQNSLIKTIELPNTFLNNDDTICIKCIVQIL